MLKLASITHFDNYSVADFDDHRALNQSLVAGFLTCQHSSTTRKDHFFAGRYENIYINETGIPALATLRQAVLACASEMLGVPAAELYYGAWFNAMAPGDVTLPHSHDDYDEQLSAVYYIQTEPECGSLELHVDAAAPITITPQDGRCVFFSPACEHAVSQNLSNSLRLSLGINIGIPGKIN